MALPHVSAHSAAMVRLQAIPVPSSRLRRLSRRILALSLLIASTLAVSVLTHAALQQSVPTAHQVVGTALPTEVALLRGGRTLDLAALDGGVQTQVALDRRDGFTTGTTADYRDGPRHLRLLSKLYRTSSGAARAYAREAVFLHRILPDPVLHARIVALPGVGASATLATYTSALGRLHYTATALVAVKGTRVCEIQGFPQGTSDGAPARDARDLRALAVRCLAQQASGSPLAR